MNLPQELIEEILSYLSSRDKQDQQSLRNCSLVAKSWINPSRRRLFETVVIRTRDRQPWLDKISPSNIELLRHVRSFCFASADRQELVPPSKHTDIEDFYVYFPSFHRLHTIKLLEAHISERIEMFLPSQRTLSSLILVAVSFPWHSFIALIDYFPNLRNLGLTSLSFEDDKRNPPPLSRPLRGKLCFNRSRAATVVTFSDWLCTGPEVEYEELAIDEGYLTDAPSRRIIAACGKTLKRLRFQSSECVVSWITLRTLTGLTRVSAPVRLPHCPELRELEFSALYPNPLHMATISTITSINIWKITFSSCPPPMVLHIFLSHRCWTSFDDCISALADNLRKLGSKQTLEVEFRSEHLAIDPPSVDYKEFLPKFSEKGRVTIVHHFVKWMSPGACRLFSLTHVVLPSDSDSSKFLDRTGCMMGRSDVR